MRYACERCRDEVAVRDELSHLERARLAAHLEACTSCRSFADRWAATIESARTPAPALTEARKDAILDLVGLRCEPPRRPRVPRRRALAVALPAAGLLLLVLELVPPGSEVAGRLPAPREAARQSPAAPPSPPAAAARPERRRAAPAERRKRSARALAAPREIASSRTGDLPLPREAGSLYAEAERALEEGRPAEAARLLEELVERAPETPEAQTARLELGMLYAGDLKRPARSVDHLSAFVAREREPSARGAAKGLLCQLLPAGERVRVCWPGLAALGSR